MQNKDIKGSDPYWSFCLYIKEISANMVTDLEPFEHDDDDNVEPEQEHEPEPEPVNWICKTCTLMNEAKKNFCTACGAQNSTPASNIANSNTKKKN